VQCLLRGESNKLIAKRFSITEATIKVHIKSVLRKIKASNRTQAAIWAHSHGYLPALDSALLIDGKGRFDLN
jgi:two-component system nitrate/nitrite response regulator NarL